MTPFSAYLQTLTNTLAQTETTTADGHKLPLDTATAQACDLILGVKARGAKVMLLGNGGSAAIASHLQNDLSKAVGVRALVFTEAPLLTALTNDIGYHAAYERQVGLWAEAGDLLIAISSSGRSPNILDATQSARAKGCQIITFSGFAAENPLRQLGDLNFYIPSVAYGVVELAHQVLAHYLTDNSMGDMPALY